MSRKIKLSTLAIVVAGIVFFPSLTQAGSINWNGFTWTIKSALKCGPGPNDWNPENVFVDTNGFLHLKITYNKTRGMWECAELYTTNDLGFGTYQWQVESSLDKFDPRIVLGLFPYSGPDGVNEIDVEFSRWSRPGNMDGWWTVYPSSGTNIGLQEFDFTLRGTYTTSRFTWSSNSIHYWMMGGFQPADITTNVINSWNYTPEKPTENIPQTALPLHMNLWLHQGHPPINGQPVEVIIRSFTKI